MASIPFLRSKKTKWILAIVVAFIALRSAAPFLVKSVINDSLEKAEGLGGSVDSVGLRLFRGAYIINQLDLYTIVDGERHPFLQVDEVDISIFWGALLSGRLVSEITLEKPILSLSDTRGKEENKYESVINESSWLGLREELVPLQIDRFEITNGIINFTGLSPNEDFNGNFTLKDMNLLIVGLKKKAPTGNEKFPARLQVDAKVYGDSNLYAEGQFDAFSINPNFDLDATVDDINVKHLDKLIKIYAPFDIEAGSFRGAMKIKAVDGEVDGYLKVGAKDLNVFSWKQDIEIDNDNPLQAAFDALIGGISALLTNRESSLLATKIPIEGNLNEPDTSVFTALINLVRNAFIQAIDIDVDKLINAEALENEDSTDGNHPK